MKCNKWVLCIFKYRVEYLVWHSQLIYRRFLCYCFSCCGYIFRKINWHILSGFFPLVFAISLATVETDVFWQKHLVPGAFSLKNISLLLISVTFLYLSTILSSMSAVGKETREPEKNYCLRWKLYCYYSPSHQMPENFVHPTAICLSFVFFVF